MSTQPRRNTLISGVFNDSPDQIFSTVNASVSFDHILYEVDIRASIAHATMLAKQAIITAVEKEQIIDGLTAILADIQSGNFEWQTELEDVHMNIEAALIKRIGEAGKKLHTGRSRNDQVATDLRLWLREANSDILTALKQCRKTLIEKAQHYASTIMPGFTHLQSAQPISFGHHLMAWESMLNRDNERLQQTQKRINQMPLGSAALAGTTYPIDRMQTCEALAFEAPCTNSLDAVSDRDFAIEFCQNAALLMMHLSRMCEEIILWNSAHFQFITLSDKYTTGSSIMPQKKNPDAAELIRGKAARVLGHSIALLALMKNQPLAYNKDNQEDKEPLFDTVSTTHTCLILFNGMLQDMQANPESMLTATKQGYTNATDLADYLVRKGIPFREAHAVVGQCVKCAISQNIQLDDLTIETLQKICNKIDTDVYDAIKLETCLQARNHIGGTAPQQVLSACENALKNL